MTKGKKSHGGTNVVARGGKRKKTDDDIVDAVVVDGKEDPKDNVDERVSGGGGGDIGDIDRDTDTAGKEQHQQQQLQSSSSGSESLFESKFDVRQRVIARDEDGLMYFSDIRRKMYGINHQQNQSALQTIGKGAAIFDDNDQRQTDGTNNNNSNNDPNDDEPPRSEWMYFVHYEGWKTLWDRWVTEDDILEATPENIKLMETIQSAHRALQKEFKAKTQQRKIKDGGLFIKMWKERLDSVMESWNNKVDSSPSLSTTTAIAGGGDKGKVSQEEKKKSSTATDNDDPRPQKNQRTIKSDIQKKKKEEERIKDLSKLALSSSLTKQKTAHAQALPFAFGLKRVLVEDWEIINGIQSATSSSVSLDNWKKVCMVHSLPPKLTIRDVLKDYLEEKGVTWDRRKDEDVKKNDDENTIKPSSDGDDKNKGDEHQRSLPSQNPGDSMTADDLKVDVSDSGVKPAAEQNQTQDFKGEATNGDKAPDTEDGTKPPPAVDDNCTTTNDDTETEDTVPGKEWIDMVDGICMYFEQSLSSRLLYPAEFAQLLAMENASRKKKRSTEEDPHIPAPLEYKIDMYGCEHLLRLLSMMPKILEEHFRDVQDRKKKQRQIRQSSSSKGDVDKENEEDTEAAKAFEDTTKTIIAKLQDLTRFLQKHQSKLFCQRYRKLTDDEIKADETFMKRQKRKLEKKIAMRNDATTVVEAK
mmetsp:Transcript_32666/g.79381  ORF Transcript_32666/g.79381 Transcript_32666/m.79381 type:complete len:696 (+) Transcript_32666:122-2209(+)